MYASAGMATLYFVVLPVVWLGVLGAGPARGATSPTTLGPTFAPLLGGGAKAAAIWFMVFNMFHGTLQPLAGAVADAVAALRGRAAAALLGQPQPPRRAVDPDPADRGHVDRLPALGRSSVDDRRRQLHLPDRHRPAERRRLAAAAQRARSARAPTARRAGRSCSAWSPPGCLGPLDGPRLRAVRPADGAGRPRAGLRRLGALRLALLERPPPRRPAARSALAAPQADRRDARS